MTAGDTRVVSPAYRTLTLCVAGVQQRVSAAGGPYVATTISQTDG